MKLTIGLVFVGLASLSLAQNFRTRSFDSDYNIQSNGTVVVTERIGVTFTKPQHGIVRKLPVRTQATDGRTRDVDIQVLDVSIDTGTGVRTVNQSTSRQGGDLSIRIGSASQTLSGNAICKIKYKVLGAMTPINKSDNLGARTELLWNVWPTNWATEIKAGVVSITYPKPEPGIVIARVLAGERGSRRGLQLQYGGKLVGRSDLVKIAFPSKTNFQIDLINPLPANQSATVVLGLPKGTVTPPAPMIHAQEQSQPSDYSGEMPEPYSSPQLPSLTPIFGAIPLLASGLVYLLARPRWAQPEKPMVVRFDPPKGFSAPLCGTIIDNKVDTQDVLAGIIALGQQKALIVRQVHPGEVEFEMLQLENQQLSDFEYSLHRELTQIGVVVTAANLKGSFGPSFRMLASKLRKEGEDSGLLVRGGKGGLWALLLLLTLVSTFGLCIFAPTSLIGGVVALILGGIFIARVSPVTPQGQDVRRDIQGLKEFIVRAKQPELNYMVDKQPDQAMFERLLPYAVAFNAVKQWSEAFEGINLSQPDWYDGNATDIYWLSAMTYDLDGMRSDIGSAMTYVEPTSYSSGSGFSSGDSGFGGGFDSSSGSFDSGSSSGDGGGGGGGDSW